MRVRYEIENILDHDGSSPLLLSKNIIECPQINDVVFRQGGSLISYPGNVMIRSLIAIKFKEQKKAKTRKLIIEIIEDFKGCEPCGRFLVWNDLGWWNEIFDEKQIYTKIGHLVKSMKDEQRKKMKNHKLNLKGGTFIFQSQDGGGTTTFGNNKRQRLTNSEEYEKTETTHASECFGKTF